MSSSLNKDIIIIIIIIIIMTDVPTLFHGTYFSLFYIIVLMLY